MDNIDVDIFLSALICTVLAQVILTGCCDSIARRAPLGAVKSGSRHKRLTGKMDLIVQCIVVFLDTYLSFYTPSSYDSVSLFNSILQLFCCHNGTSVHTSSFRAVQERSCSFLARIHSLRSTCYKLGTYNLLFGNVVLYSILIQG